MNMFFFKTNSPFLLTKLPYLLLLFLPLQAHAYIGPGMGLGVAVTVLGLAIAFFLLLVGLIWLPIRRLLKSRRPSKTDNKSHS